MPNKLEVLKQPPDPPRPPGSPQAECQGKWQLFVRVKIEETDQRPEGNLTISTKDVEVNGQKGGGTSFKHSEKPFVTKVGEKGDSPIDLALMGAGPYTCALYAKTADGFWHSKEELKVELNELKDDKKALLATLAVVKSRALRVQIDRDGKAVANLTYELVLEGPADPVRGKTDANGRIDLPVPALTKGARLYLNLGEPDPGARPGVVKSRNSATDALLLVFDGKPGDKAEAERIRLRNQGYFPPDRVSDVKGGDADELAYQHGLALGTFLEYERSFAGGTLGPRRPRNKRERLDESKSGHVWLRDAEVEDEFTTAKVSHLGDVPMTYPPEPKKKGALARFHDDYVWNGKFGATGNQVARSALDGMSFIELARAIEQATGERCNTCKGAGSNEHKIECSHCSGLMLEPGRNPVYQRRLRPHLFFAVKSCRDWNEVKERCLERYPDGSTKGRQVMFALIAFRNHYIKSMVTSLRNDHGLGVVAQAVGSADATSDYDVTLAGPDDIHAFAEANEAFRNAWGKESGVVFDTNFYFLREWLTVGNNIVKDRNGTDAPGDAFNQLEMDEQTSDLYSLAKIRRYTSKAEWAALTKAVCNQVQLDGREAAQLPLFRRLGLVDDIYRTQYVMPLLTRLGDLHQRWIAALKQGGHAPKDDEDMTKRTPRTLERLIHWDRNAVLKACNLAYLEVIHLEREAEKQILAAREYQEGPQMKVKRIWRETMAKSVVQRPESGLNEAGVYQRNRLCGKLFSEAHLFAAESYNSQASMKDVVAKQGNFRSKLKFTAHEYLHCFNEQIGDALKEVREYQRMVDEYLEQEKGFAHGGEKKTKADDEPVGVGFYRASKYEVRLKEALGNLLVSLQGPKQAADDAKQLPELHPDRRIARRRELWPALFDGAKAPDEADLLLLKKEIDFADNWKDVLQPLLNIRKSEKEAAGLTAEQKRNRAREIVNGVVGSASFKRAASDPERQATKIAYEKADAKYVPKGEEWQLRHLTDYLLHHCAQVNQVVRRLLSRSEMELHADLAPDEAPQAGAVDRPQPPPEAPEKQPGPPQPRECKLVVELDASGAGKWPGRELTVRARNVDDYEQEKVQKVTMTGAHATVDLSGLRAFSVSVDVLVGTANRKAGFQCWMWETVEVPADGSTVKLAARIDWEEPRPPDVQPLQLGRSGKLSAGTLEKLGQLARTCEYTVAKSYGELACWNWALTAFQSALVPKGWWPENVFGYLNDREIYGNEIDPDCRDALRAIEYESDADDRDARRLEAIDNAMSLIVAKYGLERTKEKTNYSLHMYFHKRRYDWEKDPTDKKGKRMRRKAWGGDYDGPNFQHVWLEVVDSKQRTWVIEHFPGSNLRLTRRRQDVSEGDDYGLWSANLTGLLEQHRKLIDELADRGIRINEE